MLKYKMYPQRMILWKTDGTYTWKSKMSLIWQLYKYGDGHGMDTCAYFGVS